MSVLMWTATGPVVLPASPEEVEIQKTNLTTQLGALREQTQQLRELAESKEELARELIKLQKQVVASLLDLYSYLEATIPEHPLLANLLPQVQYAAQLYGSSAYQQALLQTELIESQIAALHALEPGIPIPGRKRNNL